MRAVPQGAAANSREDQLRSVLAGLDALGIEELRAEWRRVHRVPAPTRFSRDLLLRGVAHKLQEAALGGLPTAARRALALPDRSNGSSAGPAAASPVKLKPGATLVREWHGQTHTVLVLEDGFQHGGQRYASLTSIARLITGAHWSGPRFFGLARSATQAGSHGGDEDRTGRDAG